MELLTGAKGTIGMRTRLLTRLEGRGRPAYLVYVLTPRPEIGIGHPWGGGLLGQAQAAVSPWKGEERSCV